MGFPVCQYLYQWEAASEQHRLDHEINIIYQTRFHEHAHRDGTSDDNRFHMAPFCQKAYDFRCCLLRENYRRVLRSELLVGSKYHQRSLNPSPYSGDSQSGTFLGFEIIPLGVMAM